MARFIGTVQGNRKEVSRCGTAKSGLTTICNGWDIGARCELQVINNVDQITIYLTSGSNQSTEAIRLGTFTLDEDYNIIEKV